VGRGIDLRRCIRNPGDRDHALLFGVRSEFPSISANRSTWAEGCAGRRYTTSTGASSGMFPKLRGRAMPHLRAEAWGPAVDPSCALGRHVHLDPALAWAARDVGMHDPGKGSVGFGRVAHM
jgi:hypothetical protein